MQDQREHSCNSKQSLRDLADPCEPSLLTHVENPNARLGKLQADFLFAESEVYAALTHFREAHDRCIEYFLKEQKKHSEPLPVHIRPNGTCTPSDPKSKRDPQTTRADEEASASPRSAPASPPGPGRPTSPPNRPTPPPPVLLPVPGQADHSLDTEDNESLMVTSQSSLDGSPRGQKDQKDQDCIRNTWSAHLNTCREHLSDQRKAPLAALRSGTMLDIRRSRRRSTALKSACTVNDFNVTNSKSERKLIVENLLRSKSQPEPPGTLFERLTFKIDRCMTQWKNLEEPTHEGRVAEFLLSGTWSGLAALVILVDALCTAYATNYGMANATPETTKFTKVMELVTLAFYITELLLKLKVHRSYYFTNEDASWNVFDMVLVVQATLDAIMTYALGGDAGNITFMKLLRLLKLAKILRLFRAVRMLTELRIIFASITNSFCGLFWAFVTLALILYIFALMFVQGLTGYVIDEGVNVGPINEQIKYYFGSVQTAALTLYKCTSGGLNWHDMYVIVSEAGPIASAQYIFFIGFFNFALLNILTGIFMEKALQASQPERDMLMLETRKAEEKEVQGLMAVFKRMDLDGSGTLTHEEYLEGAQDKNVQAYLKSLGLNTESAEMFFSVLEQMTGCGDVPVADFVEGCGRMKGYATAMDMQCMAYQVKHIRNILIEMSQALLPDTGEADGDASTSPR